MSIVEIGEFESKGKVFKTLSIKKDKDSKHGFTFGVKKANLILTHMDEIMDFVKENIAEIEEETKTTSGVTPVGSKPVKFDF